MNITQAVEAVRQGTYDETLKKLYPRYDSDREKYIDRIFALMNAYKEHFPEPQDIHLFSAPGRIEVGGNHTDHQHGQVLAAAINQELQTGVLHAGKPVGGFYVVDFKGCAHCCGKAKENSDE